MPSVLVSGFLCVWFLSLSVDGSFLSTSISRDEEESHDISKRQSIYGVTNNDILRSTQRLEKGLKSLENKLARHEFREREIADFSTKTLNALNSGQFQLQSKVQSVARQLAKMEEKMFSLEALLSTTDERQRHTLSQLREGINRLLSKPPSLPDLPALPPKPSDVDMEKEMKKINRKLNSIQGFMANDFNGVRDEVKTVSNSLSQITSEMQTQFDDLSKDWNTCNNEYMKEVESVANALSATKDAFSKTVLEAEEALKRKAADDSCNLINNDVVDKLNALNLAYQDQEREIKSSYKNTQKVLEEQGDTLQTILTESRTEWETAHLSIEELLSDLKSFQDHSNGEFEKITKTINTAISENLLLIRGDVKNLSSVLDTQSTGVMNALEESVYQVENLQERIVSEFSDLTDNLDSLKKVEHVMLSTADAVLDTKRSIEFGIQQIILELSEIVKNSGHNINTTLSDQINSISFAILKNQTSALTNMTLKMENEISQVWRQIGIMYQQVSESANILGDLRDTTAQQMNASLDKVGNMDGAVGQINTKVADVEDNLNYLLGRLSLVVSEFSQMKTGVGAELNRLRDMAKEFSGNEIHEYEVNRKRRSIT